MEFIRISKSKIKVILTPEECHRHKIIAKDGEYDNAQLKESLPDVFKELKSSAGFDLGTEKVLIQLYPTEKQGCEMYVTVLEYLSSKDRCARLGAENLNTYEKRRSQYRFATLADFTRALKMVRREGIDSDLFYDANDGYYLSVCDNVFDGDGELGYFIEYAQRVPQLPRAYMIEHYVPLALGNAIDVFRILA